MYRRTPVLPLGSDIGQGMPGEPAYYSGRITDTHGKPIANCCLDVWSGDGEGVYDMQMGGDAGMRLRARFHTDAEAADLVTEMTKVRHPMDVGRKGQRGIEW